MNYNFDEIINRNGTDSVKWDAVERRWGRNDLIPIWAIHLPAKNGPNPLLTGSKNGMDGRFVKKC